MKAFILDKYAKNARLRLGDLPEPTLKENDILVEIHATSINPLDLKIRDGEFKPILPYKTPLVLGHDVAGVVVKVGSKVQKFEIGDEIYARPRDGHIGGFAELISFNEDDAAFKPNNLTMEQAASLPLVALTAWQLLTERAKIKPEQKILIHAGSGGVGTMAIQLAKHFGAFVATTTSAANIDMVKALGADTVIDYRAQDFAKALSGYDVAINSLGSDTLEKSVKVLNSGGLLISISGPPDPDFAKRNHLNIVLQLVIRLISCKIRKKAKAGNVTYAFHFMHASGQQLADIATLIESETIKPVVDRVYPFEKTNEALDYVATGRSKGKVVIKVK